MDVRGERADLGDLWPLLARDSAEALLLAAAAWVVHVLGFFVLLGPPCPSGTEASDRMIERQTKPKGRIAISVGTERRRYRTRVKDWRADLGGCR